MNDSLSDRYNALALSAVDGSCELKGELIAAYYAQRKPDPNVAAKITADLHQLIPAFPQAQAYIDALENTEDGDQLNQLQNELVRDLYAFLERGYSKPTYYGPS